MKKYNLIYAKKTAVRCFLIALPVSGLFFVLSLFYNAVENDILYSLYIIIIALVVWIALLLRIPFAYMLLGRQKKLLDVDFYDEDAVNLYKNNKSLIYLSIDWLIFSGTACFHRDYIEKLTIRSKKRKNHTDYYHLCIIVGTDKRKYYKLLDSQSSGKKIRDWYGGSFEYNKRG